MSTINHDLQMEIKKDGSYVFTVTDEHGKILHQRKSARLYIAARIITRRSDGYLLAKEYSQNHRGLMKLKEIPVQYINQWANNEIQITYRVLPHYGQEMIRHQERQPVYI
jgi:hypothetical protein